MKNDIAMKEVKSSQIQSVGYCPDTKRLSVQFINGGCYQYAGVPPEVHAELQAAESVGKFIHARLKARDGEGQLLYPFTKMDAESDEERA